MERLNGTRPLARYEIATGSVIAYGDLVALNNSGKAVPAADAAGLRVIGVAERVAGNEVEVMDGVFSFANDTVNAVTRADRGKLAYIKDSKTVAASGGTCNVVAGIVVDVYEGEVYLDVTPAAVKAAAAGELKQAAAVADCTPAGDSATSVETQLNALLAALRTAGIIAANA